MKPSDLLYPNLKPRLAPIVADGWSESEAFVLWFLLNVFRLDDTTAQDAICDGFDDKGVDAIYVDNDQEIVYVFQSRLTQKTTSTQGDTDLKEFAGTLQQFSSRETLEKMIAAGARPELVRLITEGDVINKIDSGYKVVGVFLTNRKADANAKGFLDLQPVIQLYDRHRISDHVLDVEFDRSIEGSYTFGISYAGALQMQSGNDVTLVVAPVAATDLIKLDGIADGTLFQRNVRLSLGSTPVNKDIAKTIASKDEHERFVLYHNGITILCHSIELDPDAETVTIKGYSVVNGAQSLSTLYHNAKNISSDLRVLAKFISLQDKKLADRITWNNNN